jgi:hypothetical protein
MLLFGVDAGTHVAMGVFNGLGMKHGLINPIQEPGNQERREYPELGRLFMGHAPVVKRDP